MSSWTGNERILYVYLGLLVFRGDNVVCFNANMLQYWTLVMSVWLEHILCSISCGIHWGYRRELRYSTSCNCLSRRWTSSSRGDTIMFSIMCWTSLWYQPAHSGLYVGLLEKLSWASLPAEDWEKTRLSSAQRLVYISRWYWLSQSGIVECCITDDDDIRMRVVESSWLVHGIVVETRKPC